MHSVRSQRRDWLSVAAAADFRRRALPSLWACLALLVALMVVLGLEATGIRAITIALVALLCHFSVGRPGMVPFKRSGCATLLLVALLMPLSEMFGPLEADLLAGFAVAVVAALLLGCVGRVWRLSAELKRAVVAFDDAELLALLPAEVVPRARCWIEGGGEDDRALASVLSLAVLHLALGRCGVAPGNCASGSLAG